MFRNNPMVTGGRLLVSIGYKYNLLKVIYFIVTEDTWITKAGIPYLYKYPDHFSNIAIHPVAHPLGMYKLFGSVHEVKSHNQSR